MGGAVVLRYGFIDKTVIIRVGVQEIPGGGIFKVPPLGGDVPNPTEVITSVI